MGKTISAGEAIGHPFGWVTSASRLSLIGLMKLTAVAEEFKWAILLRWPELFLLPRHYVGDAQPGFDQAQVALDLGQFRLQGF